MNILLHAITQFLTWLLRLFGIRQPCRYRIECVEEAPDVLRPSTIYCLGIPTPWSAVLACPCRCGAPIYLSLMQSEKPSWKLTQTQEGRPTLSPSIWRTEGCRSHFWIRDGKMIFV